VLGPQALPVVGFPFTSIDHVEVVYMAIMTAWGQRVTGTRQRHNDLHT
jgi:hypothetical protein